MSYFANPFSIDVLVKGKPITKYDYRGDVYIEGRPGSSYQIKITNNRHHKVKAVISVDGLSVINGKTAAEDGPGYIINPYSSILIDGWRTDSQTVSQFVFGNKSSSYSNKSGKGTANVGVIGVVCWEEATRKSTRKSKMTNNPFPNWAVDYSADYSAYDMPVCRSITTSCSTNSLIGSAVAVSSINNVGTEFGEDVTSVVENVNFESGSKLGMLAIYYDDRRGLEARGIIVDNRYQKPSAFPLSKPDRNNYCKRV